MERSSAFLLLPKFFLFVIVFIASAGSSTATVPAIYIFGDSIFDAGTNHFHRNCTVQADFPPYGRTFFHRPTGRFTNGRTVADFVCHMLGIDLQKPYLEMEMQVRNGSRRDYPANGMNFASAGSGVIKETNADSGATPIHTQLQQFESLVQQNKINKDIVRQSFFFLESGSNDIFQYFTTPKADADAFVVKHVIRRFYELGARRVAIFGLGPVGCVPARVLLGAPVDACHDAMNQMVINYNLGLEALVRDIMPKNFPGALAVYGATFDVVQRFRAFPEHYGFADTTNACCGAGPLGGTVQCGTGQYQACENPDEVLFWDWFHPTEHAYRLIAKAFWGGKRPSIRPLNLRTLANVTVS
ncbi:lipolytic enzyme [Asimina triloba]